ncbi:hypothetical protein BO71DRAFT_487896 [Aspergillus ellipticus CBS 707.79]|uniref:Uncharacterized protein n=1 Tax=Aspergillus ellipticus CBS 707.79 TaxID=1448320 RepID=A0A319EEN4_9EURO|nr:hypothetical protein BO71DRAFT_487896 [Aspergillus ellipticus CBS 707.79]
MRSVGPISPYWATTGWSALKRAKWPTSAPVVVARPVLVSSQSYASKAQTLAAEGRLAPSHPLRELDPAPNLRQRARSSGFGEGRR